jgi:hypothetical protein
MKELAGLYDLDLNEYGEVPSRQFAARQSVTVRSER